MMDCESSRVEWTSDSCPNSRSHNRDSDASLLGWGAASGEVSTGGLVGERDITPHQCPGVDSRSTCDKSIREKQGKHACPPEDGQQESNSLYQPHGRHKITDPVTISLQPVVMVSTMGNDTISRASTRGRQYHSGYGIKDTTIIRRVDAGEERMPKSPAQAGPMLSGPLCIQAEQPTEEIHQLAARSICNVHKCLPILMARGNRVCLPSFRTDWQMPAESAPGRLHNRSDNPNMGHTTVVPSSGETSTAPPCTREAAARPLQQDPPFDSRQSTQISRMEGIRRSHSADAVSERA